jgi:hypothetical protein
MGFAILGVMSVSAQVQTSTNVPSDPGYVCVQRGPNSRIWRVATLITNADDSVTTNLQSYTELGTGVP